MFVLDDMACCRHNWLIDLFILVSQNVVGVVLPFYLYIEYHVYYKVYC